MTVEFRLLGDVEVRIGDRVVDLGHARQRCVLVALLVEANRVVTADQLLERIWGDRPPQRARNALSGYVSRLRQVLAGGTGAAITRRPSGYLLSVHPTAVDLYRFQHLVEQARTAAAEQDALAGYDQALRLWQGDAFGTLDTPWLNGVRAALDAQRLAAELDRNDIALRYGRHAALLDEVSARAEAYPLDERLAGQLILALYRSGRQADALLWYERLRRGLAEELGADPSPPLRRLHQQILASDPALAAPPTPPPSPVPSPPAGSAGAPAEPDAQAPVPRQLPAPPRSFTGRAAELAALDTVAEQARARSAVAACAISGTAGVGKTALAVYWAHQAAASFLDGQLYVNLRGFEPSGSAMDPADAVRGLLDMLGVQPQRVPSTVDAQAGLYRSLLAGRRMLIVLDNARDADQVRPLLPGTPGCLVVVTSRDRLTGLLTAAGAHPLTLELPTPEEARALLADRIGAQRVAAEPGAADDIVERCARLPLALAIVAARAVTHPGFPLAQLAAELAQARGSLDTFAGGDAASDARAVFSWSYRTLGTGAARLFRLLGLHPGPDTGTAAAASLAGVPLAQARPLLAELARAHLLTEHTAGRYAFHDLLRWYARQLAHGVDTEKQREQATRRLLDHYLHTAHTAAVIQYPHRDPMPMPALPPDVTVDELREHGQALAWFTAEHAVLLATAEHAAGTGFDVHAWKLAWAMWTYLDRRGHWHDLMTAGRAALAAAGRLDDPAALGVAHRLLSRAWVQVNRFEDAHAHLRQAADAYRRCGDLAGEGHTHNNIATVLEAQGRLPEALDETRHCLALYREAGHDLGQAHALNMVGWYHAQLGEPELALVPCEQALALQEKFRDRRGQALTWHSLGYAQHGLGNYERAVACYERALVLFRELDYRYFHADTLARLGDAQRDAANPEAARAAWHQALLILDGLGHPEAEDLRVKLAG